MTSYFARIAHYLDDNQADALRASVVGGPPPPSPVQSIHSILESDGGSRRATRIDKYVAAIRGANTTPSASSTPAMRPTTLLAIAAPPPLPLAPPRSSPRPPRQPTSTSSKSSSNMAPPKLPPVGSIKNALVKPFPRPRPLAPLPKTRSSRTKRDESPIGDIIVIRPPTMRPMPSRPREPVVPVNDDDGDDIQILDSWPYPDASPSSFSPTKIRPTVAANRTIPSSLKRKERDEDTIHHYRPVQPTKTARRTWSSTPSMPALPAMPDLPPIPPRKRVKLVYIEYETDSEPDEVMALSPELAPPPLPLRQDRSSPDPVLLQEPEPLQQPAEVDEHIPAQEPERVEEIPEPGGRSPSPSTSPAGSGPGMVMEFDGIDVPSLPRSWWRGLDPDNEVIYRTMQRVNAAMTAAGTYQPPELVVDPPPRPNPYVQKKKRKAKRSGKSESGATPSLKRKRDVDHPEPSSTVRPVSRVQRMTAVRHGSGDWEERRRGDETDEDDNYTDDEWQPAKRRLVDTRPKSTPSKLAKKSSAAHSRGSYVAPRGCHSCRTNRILEQMHCDTCPNVYCKSCVDNRYDTPFSTSHTWTCPVCLDYCSCDKCMDRRGTRGRFKATFKFSSAAIYKRKTGHSLQTWLRKNGFREEGGPAQTTTTSRRPARPAKEEEEDEAMSQPEEEEEDVVYVLSEDEVMPEPPANEEEEELNLTSAHSTPEPDDGANSLASESDRSPSPFYRGLSHSEEPLFLPDTPKPPPAGQPSLSDGDRHTSIGSTSSLKTPGTFVPTFGTITSTIPTASTSSPLAHKSSEPVLVPDTGYYDDPSDGGAWNAWSTYGDDPVCAETFRGLDMSPPPREMTVGLEFDSVFNWSAA